MDTAMHEYDLVLDYKSEDAEVTLEQRIIRGGSCTLVYDEVLNCVKVFLFYL